MHKRKRFWIDPPVQVQVMATVLLLVAGSLFLVTYSIRRGLEAASLQSKEVFHSLDWIESAMNAPILVSVSVSLLASALIAMVWSHRLAGPLRVLAAAMHRVKAGDFSVPVRVRESDSLSDFVSDFAQMHDGLKAMVAEDRARLTAAAAELDSVADSLNNVAPPPEKLRRIAQEIRGAGARYEL